MTQPLFKFEPDWANLDQPKFVIVNASKGLGIRKTFGTHYFPSFETKEKAELFMSTYSDLIKTYTM